MGSTKVEAEMGVGTDFLICAREVDCGNLLPNWIAAAIKSGLWELVAKLDSSCYQPTNTAPLPAATAIIGVQMLIHMDMLRPSRCNSCASGQNFILHHLAFIIGTDFAKGEAVRGRLRKRLRTRRLNPART